MLRHLALVSLLIGTVACSSVPDRAWAPGAAPDPIGSPLGSKLQIIEVADSGRLHDPSQMDVLANWLGSAPHNEPILVFVHGWHHNAQPKDENLQEFKQFVGAVEAAAQVRVNAIYVGWRGDTWDVLNLPEPTDWWTIWDRKRASKVVGAGAVRDLVQYLRKMHSRRNVVIAGHSAGGSAVFRAVKDSLTEEIDDYFEYILLNPAVGTSEFEEVADRLRADQEQMAALGPPVGMAVIRPHRRLTVLQSLGDFPVGVLYRIAFLNDVPVGFNKDFATHTAFQCTGSCEQDPRFSPFRDAKDRCHIYLADRRFVLQSRITSNPGDPNCRETFDSAVWVIVGKDSVSKSHGDILNDIQMRALADLISRRIQGSL